MTAFYRDAGRMLARAAVATASARWMLRKASHAGVLPGRVWKRLPVQTTFHVSSSPEIGFQYSSIANDAIGRALYWQGLTSWEPETSRVFLRLARRSRWVLDIGAHTGFYTLLACATNPAVHVRAFEPVPHIYQRLCQNIRLNGWQDRCWTRNEAVSSFIGSAQFHIPYGDVPYSASLHRQGFRGVRGELIEVPVTIVDAACPEDEQVDLVKIDVEGFEDKVLEGMQRVLAVSQPAVIVECNPDGPYQAIRSILARFGYRFFHLRQGGPTAMVEIVPDVTESCRNYLCVTKRRLEWLR